MSDKTTSSSSASSTPARKPAPPRYVLYAAGALVSAGVFAVIAALTVFGGATKGPNGWLYKSSKESNDKLYGTATKHKKGYVDPAKLQHNIDSTPKSLLIMSLVLLVALSVLALSAYKGKYWARWTTVGLWVLATVTQTLAGIGSLFLVTSSKVGTGFKLTSFIAALSFLAAVVLVCLRPSVTFFAANKPIRAGGGAVPQRRGLFAPRPPVNRTATKTGTSRTPSAAGPSLTKKNDAVTKPAGSTSGKSVPDRARSKARANADAVANGAELARARAKASKSRRTGV